MKKIREIEVDGNCESGKSKMKWMKVIREKIRTCGVDKDIVYLTFYVLKYQGYDLRVRRNGEERPDPVTVE